MSSVQDGGDEEKKPETKKRGRKKKIADVVPDEIEKPVEGFQIYNLEDFILSLLGGGLGKSEKMAEAFKKDTENLHKETQEDDYDKYVSDSVKKDYDVLSNLLSEYLDSYLILGFKPDGNSVVLRRTASTRDRDALAALVGRYTMGHIEF